MHRICKKSGAERVSELAAIEMAKVLEEIGLKIAIEANDYMRSVPPLTKDQIDSIRLEPEHFILQLELFKKLNVKLVQFGGGAADWLVGIGRTEFPGARA